MKTFDGDTIICPEPGAKFRDFEARFLAIDFDPQGRRFCLLTDGTLISENEWDRQVATAAAAATTAAARSKATPDPKYFLTDGERAAIKSEAVRRGYQCRATDNIARYDLSAEQKEALTAWRHFRTELDENDSLIMDYLAVRVDGGLRDPHKRKAWRIDEEARMKAADAWLAGVDLSLFRPDADSKMTLAGVLWACLVEERNSVAIARRFWGSKTPSEAAAKDRGMNLIRTAAEILATFYGLDRPGKTIRPKPKKGDWYTMPGRNNVSLAAIGPANTRPRSAR